MNYKLSSFPQSSVRTRFTVLGIALTVLGSGLFGQTEPPVELQSDFDPAIDFTSKELFFVIDISEDQPGVDPEIVRRVAPACEDAVRSMLKAKGYSEVLSLSAADIAAYVHGNFIPKTGEVLVTKQKQPSNPNWLRGRRNSSFAKSEVTLDDYEQSTLVVEVYEVGSKNLIWMGFSVQGSQRRYPKPGCARGSGRFRHPDRLPGSWEKADQAPNFQTWPEVTEVKGKIRPQYWPRSLQVGVRRSTSNPS